MRPVANPRRPHLPTYLKTRLRNPSPSTTLTSAQSTIQKSKPNYKFTSRPTNLILLRSLKPGFATQHHTLHFPTTQQLHDVTEPTTHHDHARRTTAASFSYDTTTHPQPLTLRTHPPLNDFGRPYTLTPDHCYLDFGTAHPMYDTRPTAHVTSYLNWLSN